MRTISIPDPLHAAAEELASRTGFASTSEYIADLVRRGIEQDRRDSELYDEQFGEGADSRPRTKQDIERLMLEGLNSGPAVEMTAEDWAELHRRVETRLEGKKP